MSFFKELKEDIVQSVNELGDSLEEKVDDLNAEETEVPEAEMEVLAEPETEFSEESAEETAEVEETPETEKMQIDEEDMKKEIQKELSNIFQEDSRFREPEEEPVETEVETELEEPEEPEKEDEEIIEEKNSMEERKMSDFEETKTEEFNSEETTVITKGTTISGGIKSDTALVVKGVIEGDVECQGKLTITGRVAGNSLASEIYVNTPRLEGNLESRGSVKVDVGTVIVGSITSSSVVIAGAVKGDIDVNGPVVIDSTAVVKGNVVAKSIQINSGAVLDGFCSLKYADVDLDSFFE